MKQGVFMSTLLVLVTIFAFYPQNAIAYDFGDYRSATLTSKAWQALGEEDIEAVLGYTNKCIELYAEQARSMQELLTDFPKGENSEVFAYWALNDVSTSLYVQAEAYRKADMLEEAKEVYQRLIDDFTYGQSWDDNGWFWKPSEAAKEKVKMIDLGVNLDFGDYTSAYLSKKAWDSLAAKNAETAEAYVNKCLELYGDKAIEMQESLDEYPWESKEDVFSYWALNDVGTCLFVLGETYRATGDIEKAKEAYNTLINDFYYAQAWDPQGWFWKPAEAAQQKLNELDS